MTGINVVFNKCQGGSFIIKPCERDLRIGLYEAKWTFIPQKSQTAREYVVYAKSWFCKYILFQVSQKNSLRKTNWRSWIFYHEIMYTNRNEENYSVNSHFSSLCQVCLENIPPFLVNLLFFFKDGTVPFSLVSHTFL